ncbi:MAG: TraR/DksA family transcriptional regulator [Persicimonas sp.]
MDREQLEEFRQLLIDEKRQLIRKAVHTLENEIELSKEDMADEADLASVLTDQSLSLRLRGRERSLMDKIDLAIERIDAGEFGECVMCEEEISLKRLRARPVTTMCIACKEDEERRERHFAE